MWGKSELRMKGFVLKKSQRGEGIGEERTGTEENNGISHVGRMVSLPMNVLSRTLDIIASCETEVNYTKTELYK
jgi:hypothetical protein